MMAKKQPKTGASTRRRSSTTSSKPVFRKVDPRIWGDEKFLHLSQEGQRLFLALLTGPFTQRFAGLVLAGVGTLSDLLRWNEATTLAALDELTERGMVEVDRFYLVVRLPNALRYECPDNPNQVKSWLANWKALPDSILKHKQALALRDALAASRKWGAATWDELFGPLVTGTVPETVSQTVPDTVAETVPETLPGTVHDQEHEQEQEQRSPPKPPPPGGPSLGGSAPSAEAEAATLELWPPASAGGDRSPAVTSNGQAGSQAGNGSRRRRRAAPSLEELSPQTVAMVERLRRTWCEAFGLDVANYPPSLWVPVVPDAIAGGLTERDLELATRGAPLNGYVRRTGRREPSWILGTVERVIEFRDAFVEAENRRRSHALPEAPLAPPPEPLSPEQEGRIEQIKRDLGQRIGWKPKQAAAMPPRGPVADELRRVGGS